VSFLATGVVVVVGVVSFLATGVVVVVGVVTVLTTGVVTGSFLTIGVFDGVNSVLAGTGVDDGWPLIAAAFLAYQREEYMYIYLSLITISLITARSKYSKTYSNLS
jgi:hypothetical protein